MLNHLSTVSKKINYEFTFFKEIINHIENRLTYFKKNNKLIYVNYLLLKLFSNNSEKIFTELKKYLPSLDENISEHELKSIYIELRNYCGRMMPADKEYYLKESIKIYQKMETLGFFSGREGISHIDFLNIIVAAIAVKDLDFAGNFYNKYSDKINGILAEETRSLSGAEIEFEKKNYKEVLILLNRLNYTNFYFYIKIKILLIKTHYELNNFEVLRNLIDSVRHYLKRNKSIPSDYKSIINPFLSYAHKLINIQNYSRQEIKFYIREISLKNDIAAREWLMKKFS